MAFFLLAEELKRQYPGSVVPLAMFYQVFPLFIIVNGMVSPFINVNIKSNSVLSQEMRQKQEL